MAMDGATVDINFRARLDQLERDMAGARSKVTNAADDMGDQANDRLSKKLGNLGATVGKAAVLGIGAAAVGVGMAMKGAFDAAEESRKVTAQTEAVIASTGGAANVSSAHVGKYADQLAALTGIDDEVIASGQNMLLTFTNVRNEVGKGNNIFDQGTKAALNMSTALGTDMNQASMLVGKALNDPIAGMTALTRSGVQFTAQQKDQIKAMVEAGDTLGAQKVILKELETQFGGSAEAAASPMARLKVVVGNLQEELGARLLPVVGTVATFLANNLPGALDAAGSGFGRLVEFLTPVGAAIMAVAGFLQENVLPVVVAVAGFVQDNFIPVLAAVGAVLLVTVVPAFIAWAVAAGTAAVATLVAAAPVIALAAVLGALAFAVVYAYTHFETFRNIVDAVASFLRAVVAAAFEYIAGVVTGVIDVIVGVINTGLAIIRGDWSGAWEAIKGVLSAAWEMIIGSIRNAFGVVNALFAGLPGQILGALGDLGGLLWEKGKDIVRGLIGGVKSMAGAVVDALLGLIPGPLKKFAGLLGIGSPSKVFAGFGMNIGEGLAMGMNQSHGLVANAASSLAGLVTDAGSGNGLAGLSHSGDSGVTSSASGSGGQRAINVGPFYVRENDLPTEIPRRLRSALHLWS